MSGAPPIRAVLTPGPVWLWAVLVLSGPVAAQPGPPGPPFGPPPGWLPPRAPAAAPGSLPEPWASVEDASSLLEDEIDLAIARGERWLWAQRGPDGVWASRHENPYRGAGTALALITLRTLGVPSTDPRLVESADALVAIPARFHSRNYQASVRLMALLRMKSERYAGAIRADILGLSGSQRPSGGWAYDLPAAERGNPSADASNSQWATLALCEADRLGLELPQGVLSQALKYWAELQNPDGGFPYWESGGGSYLAMSAAGFASLVLLDDKLATTMTNLGRKRIEPPGIDKAIAWLDRNFRPDEGKGMGKGWPPYYALYSVERAGAASGLKHFADRDWYQIGSRLVLGWQEADGSWEPSDALVQTCFALLFLAKGKTPIAVAKLKFDGDWNNTPKDARLLVRWLTDQRERPLGWEVLQTGTAIFRQFVHDAPILLLSGRDAARFSDADLDTLARYVRFGGTLLAVTEPAVGGLAPAPPASQPAATLVVSPGGGIVQIGPAGPGEAPAWARDSVLGASTRPAATQPRRPLLGTAWPAGAGVPARTAFADALRGALDATLGPLGFRRVPVPSDHPIWSAVYPLPPMAGAEGWTDGVVWRAFLIPAPLTQDWDRNGVRTRVASFQLASNLLSLCTEQMGVAQARLRWPVSAFAGHAPLPPAAGQPAVSWPARPGPPGTLRVALARHAGHWLAGEAGLIRLAEAAAHDQRTCVQTLLGVDLDPAALAGVNLLWVSGSADPRLTPEQWAAILAFCRRGGFLVLNAAGGTEAFAAPLAAAVRAAFGPNNVRVLDPDHPLLSGQIAGGLGNDLRRLMLRRVLSRAGQLVPPLRPPLPAELQGLYLDGQLVGVFCTQDFTYGLTGGPAPGIDGYTADASRAIGMNLLLAARMPPERRGPTLAPASAAGPTAAASAPATTSATTALPTH